MNFTSSQVRYCTKWVTKHRFRALGVWYLERESKTCTFPLRKFLETWKKCNSQALPPEGSLVIIWFLILANGDFSSLQLADASKLPNLKELLQSSGDKDIRARDLVSWILSSKLLTIHSAGKSEVRLWSVGQHIPRTEGLRDLLVHWNGLGSLLKMQIPGHCLQRCYSRHFCVWSGLRNLHIGSVNLCSPSYYKPCADYWVCFSTSSMGIITVHFHQGTSCENWMNFHI